MKIFKRNQLIILVISLMLITVGYLNFTSNNSTNTLETSTIVSDRDDVSIGDAQLVAANITEFENITSENEIVENENLTKETTETSLQVTEENDDYYFEKAKLERSSMYSELLETYQEIYNNVNSNNDQKADAINKITYINNTKNAIMIAENLIMAKDFENVIIFVNDESISVVIKIEELKTEDVAQIQNIISRELNVETEKIHISNR